MPSEVQAVSLSEDGEAVRITTDTGHFDVSSTEIVSLVMLLSQAEQLRVQKAHGNKKLKAPHPVEWWELGNIPNSTDAVLSFQIPGGLEMSFRMERGVSTALLETLSVIVGQPVPPAKSSLN